VTFEVRFSPEADEDLGRLLDFLLDRAATVDDLDRAAEAVEAIRSAVFSQLARTPYSFRKAGTRSTLRELIIPFGATGYVALYEIASASLVVILAVRHQREEDYH
jgi:plasmid stabilization system protein ParE